MHSLSITEIGDLSLNDLEQCDGRYYCKISDRSSRLLSVQINQTPGFYARARRLSGPGFYYNMSTLFYFIQKSSTMYQYPYSVYLQNALKHGIYRISGNLPRLVCGTRLWGPGFYQ